MQQDNLSRRDVIRVGLVTGVSGALGFALAACSSGAPAGVAQPAPGGMTPVDPAGDIAILNGAIDLENQAIWAYTTAAGTGKLDGTDALSMAVKKLAVANMADHKEHAAALSAAVRSLGGTPAEAKASYDLSAYLGRKEGSLDDMAGIARLALALEYDAVLAYQSAFVNLKNMDLLKAAGAIAPDESAHAAAIRALLVQAGVALDRIVGSPFINAESRSKWVVTA